MSTPRECLAIRVARRMTAHEVLWALADLFLEYGIPEQARVFYNGPEFVAKAVRGLARRPRSHDPVHRTGRVASGERLCGTVELQAA